MSNFTNFSLSFEKGLRANIGKKTVRTKNDNTDMDVMLFLVANGDVKTDRQFSQIINAYFPQKAFEDLKDYGVGDYVRVHFDRFDLAKGISSKGEEVSYISVKANNIELLKKAEKKEAPEPKQQSEKEGLENKKQAWGNKH